MSGALSNPDLASVPAEGRTWSRWNIAALWIGMSVCILALIIGVLPNLPGFINAASRTTGTTDAIFDTLFDTIYSYGWFIGLPLAMLFYWIFMKVRPTGRAGSIT